MAVVASGEIDLRLSKASAAAIEKDIAGVSRSAGSKGGGKAGEEFAQKFEGRFGPALGKATGKLKEFAKEGELALSPMTALQGVTGKLAAGLESIGPVGAAAGAGLAALVGIAFKGIHEFLDLTGQIRKFKAISGATAEDSSKFVVALNELGVSSDQVGRGIGRLARASAQGKEPLAEFGIQVARDAKGNFDAIRSFEVIADRVKGTSDPADRAAIAFKAFGRAGLELIPILSRGSEGLKEFEAVAKLRGEVFSDADLKRARDFTIATRSLGEAFKGLEISVGQRLVGPLTEGTVGITKIIDETTHGVNFLLDHVPKVGKTLGNSFIEAAVPAVGLLNTVRSLGKEGEENLTKLEKAEHKFADTSKKDLDAVVSASNALSFTGNEFAQRVIAANLDKFGEAAAGAAVVLSTDLKTGVTDYTKALSQLDPIAARVVTDQARIAEGLDPIAAKFDLAAAAADQFNTAIGYTLTPVENLDRATIAVHKAEDAVTASLKDSKATFDDHRESVLSLVDAIQQEEAAKIRETGGIINAGQARKNFLRDIDEEIAKYPALKTELLRYRAEIERTPDEKLIDFTTQGLTNKGGLVPTLADLNETLKELTKVFEIKFGVDAGTTFIDINKIKNAVNDLPAGVKTYIDFIPQQRFKSDANLDRRASGGDVYAGQSYVIGEHRPEIFEPKQDGYVHPDAKNWTPKYGSGKVEQTNNINVYEAHSPDATAYAVSSRLAAALSL